MTIISENERAQLKIEFDILHADYTSELSARQNLQKVLDSTRQQLAVASGTAANLMQETANRGAQIDRLTKDHKDHLDNQRVHAEILIGLIRMVKGFCSQDQDDTRGQLELLEEFTRQHLTPFSDYSDIPF